MLLKCITCVFSFLLFPALLYCQQTPTAEQWEAIRKITEAITRLNASGTATPEDYQRLTVETLNNPSLAGIISQFGLADAQDNKGASLLLVAANLGNVALVETILNRGSFINLRDENGWTALTGAVRNNRTEVALYLIGRGADPNIVNTDHGEGPLMWAVGNQIPVLVEALVNAGANVNQAAIDGDTPIVLAASQGHLQIVNYLISKGADVNHQNVNGFSALMSASSNNHVEPVKALLKAGANPDLKTRDFGDTALLWAIARGHNRVVRELIVGGADFELPNNSGRTPLLLAALQNRTDEARLLLSAGADINRLDESGDTPLMDAVNKGFTNVARVILEHCPNLDIVNGNRKNVHFLALDRQNTEIQNMLKAHPLLQCNHENTVYTVGQTRYDVCREVKCCQGIWSPTGQTLDTCGDKCRKVLAPAGVCTLIDKCPILVQEFLTTVKTSANSQETGREFVRSYGCGFKGGVDLRVCCPNARVK